MNKISSPTGMVALDGLMKEIKKDQNPTCSAI